MTTADVVHPAVTAAAAHPGHAGGTARRVEHVMGMPISLALRGRHAQGPRADAAWAAALAELRRADAIFSTYRADSWVSRLARADARLGDAPPVVTEVLAIAEEARRQSDGAFDVRRPGPWRRTVLDPSGVVKGWAVDRAARAFDDLEGTDVCLSAGGDMVCRTRAVGSRGWRIGVEAPHHPGRLVAVVPVRDGAVATSGLAHRRGHLVDPRTGLVPTALASVTVVGPDLVWADIDATAAFVLGADALRWLRTRCCRTGLVVDRDGRSHLF
ncbi:FAD:protein FMN transferase [Luteimicrobium subarcticum]|uniref:FAD:protein FMN transferase n=1 Tax=Luteimicrobium subarcticum TaxID=620910 RepID=A0A2M8WTD6_9MICO|nr:FAD:protein FMN transferase [Luteimicrobium subarcticum]PJI94149.1 thiamine biosynthesis lipoprotein [Luteimicrobium subarcticum]